MEITDNLIDNRSIVHRKLVLEVRYKPIPKLIDVRGGVVSRINEKKIIEEVSWEIGKGALQIADHKDKTKYTKRIALDIHKVSLLDMSMVSNSQFLQTFNAILEELKEIDRLKFIRVGARIQSVFKSKSAFYPTLLRNFKKVFNDKVFLEDFPVNDMRFHIQYKNGFYDVGPIKENDEWIKANFNNIIEDERSHVGFALDTDNFVISNENEYINEEIINDVFLTSLTVEKELFEKLRNF